MTLCLLHALCTLCTGHLPVLHCRYMYPKAAVGLGVLVATALLNLRITQTAPVPEVAAPLQH